MRTLPTLVMVAVFLCGCAHRAFAQLLSEPLAACGDDRIAFDVSHGEVKDQTNPPEPGKAALYIVEVFNLADTGSFNRPTIKQGLDGRWFGATRGFSYLSVSIDPGEHHLCSRWQSRLSALSDQVSLYNFNAEAGKRYYFRAHILYTGNNGYSLDLEPLSTDEGRFLISQAARSLSRPKH